MWAQKKGITVLGTGDFTHPAWFSEIKEKLTPSGPGVFRLKDDNQSPVRFVLSVEISTIYKKGDKTRKIHHVVLVPDLEAAEKFRNRLDSIGNIKSDGRPILGLDSRSLLEITLEAGEGSTIIPAHIWTPWFSVLGSKSGFDSIEECYEDLSGHIFALETGLSSDPEMNWRVSGLDRYRLVSNSDAHSPSKLAREATVFDTNPDYFSIMNALKTGKGYIGTVEFFPEEGKYHMDGHRKCDVCMTPPETVKHKGICPVCGKPLTIGVCHRVNELADRPETGFIPPETAGKVYSLIPLQEILAEILRVGVNSKKVETVYSNIIQKLGSELSILLDADPDTISKADSPLLGEAITRLRAGKVIRKAGFDGEYGVIKLFEKNEAVKKNGLNLSLDIDIPKSHNKRHNKRHPENNKCHPVLDTGSHETLNQVQGDQKRNEVFLDKEQQQAVNTIHGPLMVTAGPGSGKTRVLAHRIENMIANHAIPPENCLAITFTRRAAREMKDRIKNDRVNIHTFHSLCLSILREKQEVNLISEEQQLEIFGPKILNKISKAKRTSQIDDSIAEEFRIYRGKLAEKNLVDFDDLILTAVKMLEDNTELLKQYHNRFKYISIDEYQDIDPLQYRLIRLLVPPGGNLCVIGDINQAIYGFRGADTVFFNKFKQDYPDAVEIKLKNNYRSSGTIVNASNQVIRTDSLSLSRIDPERITIHNAPTERAEAEFVVSTIEKLVGGHSFFSIDSSRSSGEEVNYSFSDFAVLYRASQQAEALVEAFERSGMPYAEISKAESLDPGAERVSLLTLHSSKGLEFNAVFIIGLEEGVLPLPYCDKEEERRLFYVGMTRAKERLYLSHSLKRPVSPFLEKIEAELLQFSRFQGKRPEGKQLSLF